MLRASLVLALTALLFACAPSKGVSDGGAELASAVYPVHCGCLLESVGHCGNYVEIDGEFLEIQGDVGLGRMEWCGRTGVHATLAGKVEGETFLASSYEPAE